MKKNNTQVLYYSILLFLSPLFAISQDYISIDAKGWSGYAKYKVITTYTSPTASGVDEWDLELNISPDQVTATAVNTFHRSDANQCSNNIKGSQEGSMKLENVSFSIMHEGNLAIFSLDAGMPVLKGNRTVCGKQETISQGDLGMLIEGLKVEYNANVISGDSTATTITNNGDEVYNEVVELSVQLSRGPVDVELIIKPDNYASWMQAIPLAQTVISLLKTCIRITGSFVMKTVAGP